MSYIKKNLMNGEIILFHTKMQSSVGNRFFVLLAFGFVMLYFSMQDYIPVKYLKLNPQLCMFIIGDIAIGTAILLLIGAMWGLNFSEFSLTNIRLVVKTGFFCRSIHELKINRIEGITVSQSFFDKMRGTGSISITGMSGIKQSFHGITSILRLAKDLREYIYSVDGVLDSQAQEGDSSSAM